MVVVLVLGILLAIGIPTFVGARDRGHDRAAQTSLRNGTLAAATLFTDNSDYSDADVAGLDEIEPGLAYVGSPTESTDANQLSVDSNPAGTVWGAAALSQSGTCFYTRSDAAGATTFGASETLPCTGAQALNAAGPDWNDTEGGIEGGFVSDLSIGGYWNTHGSGSLVGGEWDVVGGSVDANITQSNSFNYTVDGQFMDLNGNSAGHIRREVNVIPNTPYTLTMDLGENVYGGPAVKQMEIVWNGTVIDTIDVDVPQHQLESYTVAIPPSATGDGVLEFRSLLGGAYGPTMGNVGLEPTG